jgi:hypothetical protein
VSPSAGYQDYTRGDYGVLPTIDDDLETAYTEQELTDVSVDDSDYVAQTATQEFMIHQFKDYTGENNSCRLTWIGKSTLAPSSSTVYLQIYNRTLGEWEGVDSDALSDADTDFTLAADIADLSDYKDSNTVISCRIYQEAL